MFGFLKAGASALMRSSFDSDFSAVKELNHEDQLKIYRKIGPVISTTLDKMESMSDLEFAEHLSMNANVAQRLRHIAVSNGAKDKSAPEWLAAALAESFYNCMRNSTENGLYAIHQIMPWVMFMGAFAGDDHSKNEA